MTTDEKIDAYLNGETTLTGRDFVARLKELRDKGLGLWTKEVEFLDHLHAIQVNGVFERQEITHG